MLKGLNLLYNINTASSYLCKKCYRIGTDELHNSTDLEELNIQVTAELRSPKITINLLM